MDPLSPSLKAILDQVNDGVYFVDPDRNILYWNPAAERITGYRSPQVIGQFCASNILMHVNQNGESLCHGFCPLALTLKDGQPRITQVYLHHMDGHRVPVTVRVVPFYSGADSAHETPSITGAVEIFSENTSLATALSRIEDLQREAMLDPLTGIGNRRMIQSRLMTILDEWEKRNLPFGVLIVDIDHFKKVNDAYGHDTGDQVLKMVTGSLSSGLRSYDYIGRWGGAEFLALVADVDEERLRSIAERMRMLVECSVIYPDYNHRQASHSISVTVSLGGAIMKPGETLDTLIKSADRKLYECKANGRNRVII